MQHNYLINFYLITFCVLQVKGILHGKNASVNQFPFIVSLRNVNNDHLDAGSIISHRYVISSAWSIKFNPIRIIAGAVQLQSGGISYRIIATYLHPRYDEVNFRHNIGLVKTQNYIVYTDAIKPISLGVISVGENVPVIAVGWGDSKEAIKSRTNILKWANFLTIENQLCFTEMQQASMTQFYHKNLICAIGYADGGQQWCSYDFGGPLTAGNTLIGILFRPGMQSCSLLDLFPNIALRLQPYLYWINEVVMEHDIA